MGNGTAATAEMGLVRRLLDWALLSHLDAIDREYIKPGATDDRRILIVVYTSCIILFLLNYLVLTSAYQLGVARFLIGTVGIFGPIAGAEDPLRAAEPWQVSLALRISWSMGCIFFYLAIPGLIHLLWLRRPLRELGLSPKGFFRHLWIYALLFLPVAASVWVVSYQESFQNTYPFYRNPSSLGSLMLWEGFYALQFFALEVFFRGFMLNELKHRWGWRAILFMMTPYCMIHFTKPALEALGAVIAGSVLGILALRTRNIWGGVTIHVAVAWSMDFASLLQRGWFENGMGG
jgi:membrane protease YdiL (CAAX protease family)